MCKQTWKLWSKFQKFNAINLALYRFFSEENESSTSTTVRKVYLKQSSFWNASENHAWTCPGNDRLFRRVRVVAGFRCIAQSSCAWAHCCFTSYQKKWNDLFKCFEFILKSNVPILEAGGKPSTWFPPEELVEPSCIFRMCNHLNFHWKILFCLAWDYLK